MSIQDAKSQAEHGTSNLMMFLVGAPVEFLSLVVSAYFQSFVNRFDGLLNLA